MSTRCQIGFYNANEQNLNNFEALIYRHCDGYPKGVLPDLIPFLKDFDKNRGIDDIEYAAANLVVYLRYHHCGEPSNTRYTGLGICKHFYSDIEFFYAIYGDGTVKVFKVKYDAKPSEWTEIGKFNIKEELFNEENNSETIEIFAEDIEQKAEEGVQSA